MLKSFNIKNWVLVTVLAAVVVITACKPAPGELPFWAANFKTDLSRHSVPYNELIPGALKDGIPAIDKPQLETIAQADQWLKDVEPVISLEFQGESRAYPLQILIWHEIVNDMVAGRPLLITFCPLCNTALAFERTVQNTILDFGVSGLLRYSDLVMYDRQTESLWQQANGEAIIGNLTGTKLPFVPVSIVSWADFKAAFPQGRVLSTNTGFSRDYGSNPYVGYDRIDQSPFLYHGPTIDGRLPPMERVIGVSLGEHRVAYPFSVLSKSRIINDRIGDKEVVVFYKAGTASPLDTSAIVSGKDIGSAAIYEARLQGRLLSFKAQKENFVDQETGTTWNLLGQATSGQLQGRSLKPVVHGNHFWFFWAALEPATEVRGLPPQP